MGNTCCMKRRKKKIVLLLLGLDNAGKTAAAKGLAGEPLDTVVPTVGFSTVTLSNHNCSIKIYDLGGGSGIRGIWPRYFVDAHGVIFVIDSSDTSRLCEVKCALESVLSDEKIMGKPVLILANKQDRENALDEIDLVDMLDLEDLVNEKKCPTLVESCSATEITNKTKVDSGIKKGYHWLINYIIREYANLNERVQTDVREQEIIEHQLRQEKLEKLRLIKESEQRKLDEDRIESYSEYNRKLNDTELQNGVIRSASNSSESSGSFPPLYFGNVTHENQVERPKSATQIVKEHLELGELNRKMSLRSNKTSPINLLGAKHSHSAKEKRKDFSKQRRALKSAGDSVFVHTELPNIVDAGPHGDDFRKEIFQLNNFKKGKKKGENGVPWCHTAVEVRENSISVIDID